MHVVLDQNRRMRSSYQFFMKGCFVLSLLATVMCAVLLYTSTHKRYIPYYATTQQGDVIPMVSLSEPLMTDERVEQWASIVARSAYSLNFASYLKQVNAVSPYFTKEGFYSYIASMKKSGFYKAVMAQHMISQAIVSGRPNLAEKYVQAGRLYWVIQLPLLVGYTTASVQNQRHYMLTLTVSRVPVLESLTGIQLVGVQLKAL